MTNLHLMEQILKEAYNMKLQIIDVDEIEQDDYAANIVYLSKEYYRYCFLNKVKNGYRVGMGRGDVPRNHPQYSKDTGIMTLAQAQRVMYDFMRGEI